MTEKVTKIYNKQDDTKLDAVAGVSAEASTNTFYTYDSESESRSAITTPTTSDSDYLGIYELNSRITVPQNVTVYVLVSEGETLEDDETVLESGCNYEFIGYYYDDKGTEDDDTDDECYAVTITDPEYDTTENDGGFTHSFSNDLEFLLQVTQECNFSFSDAEGQEEIDKMVTFILNIGEICSQNSLTKAS